MEFENFNAAKAVIEIQGRSVHPGYAKEKMINAGLVAMEFNALLPSQERPAFTDKYEGFFHLDRITGNVEKARLVYLVRDHDALKFKSRCDLINRSAAWLNQLYGSGTVTATIENQYTNMREKIEPVFWIVELAQEAMRAVGVTPAVKPVRGGTDGAQLSWKGLPTPNLFTGGHNAHGNYEFIPTFTMEKAVEVLIKLVELGSQRK